ncbi:MAG: NAD(P)H-dependent oxidoreductase [Paracoccus sp. (in: a-proteobacteria)]|uniref:NAD(P)H-dependent oxidoreductase n=1 Tax=Paracoccus sp. TaxID=267 RepID=UPI0026E06636|nr:NAD(P)H-dependent oxidoreductase [Paracoccus sp. (in: a-proteobacteria)]MDO5630224.1 NAD(P)H-dependent oxidoreductase [Paracoccus sp. (in: a-proteobacteria)]
MTQLKIAAISGTHHRPSRTNALIAYLAQGLGSQKARCFDIFDMGRDFGMTFDRDGAAAGHAEAWDAVVSCDILVVGTPVYKASCTGLFKHFFDLLPPDALKNRLVVLSANARAPVHALMIDHQLTPLFRFFGALPAPHSIFALDEEFEKAADGSGFELQPSLIERCDKVICAALALYNEGCSNRTS